jgi:LmbE family N-acetylglucosaminyl deacetylase
MSHALSLRPRALAAIEGARESYAPVDHRETFLAELEAVFEAIQPLRFPVVHGKVHRALLRRYPFAVFFRVRPTTDLVVVLAVLLQRGDPAKWPQR